jgi:hypothetical protein
MRSTRVTFQWVLDGSGCGPSTTVGAAHPPLWVRPIYHCGCGPSTTVGVAHPPLWVRPIHHCGGLAHPPLRVGPIHHCGWGPSTTVGAAAPAVVDGPHTQWWGLAIRARGWGSPFIKTLYIYHLHTLGWWCWHSSLVPLTIFSQATLPIVFKWVLYWSCSFFQMNTLY